MNIKHRVVKDMKHPLVSAGDVVDKGNIVLMTTEGGFVAPLSSNFGHHLNQAIYDLAARYGTQDNLALYRDWGNVFKFDAWVRQPPKGMNTLGRASGKSGARAPDDPAPATPPTPKAKAEAKAKVKSKKNVSIKTDSEEEEETRTINEDEHERPYEGSWRVVQKSKKSNSKESASARDQITTAPFGRLIPNWP